MRAQDQALVTLARRAGLLDRERESHAVSALRAGGVAALVREGLLAADAASALLRELTASRFACDGCGAASNYAALANLDDLACPACRRPLTIQPTPSGARATGAHRVSGAHAVIRPSDRFPAGAPSRPSGAFGAVGPAGPSRPSGAFGAVGPAGPSQPSGAFGAVRPSGAFAAARPSGAFPTVSSLVAPTRPSDRAPAAPPPRRVGRYALVRELGRGSNGVVWLAERDDGGERVALKLLTRSAAADPTTLERFRREARITSRLTHPGIVPVVDAGVEGEVPYLVMAYCPGPTLQDRLRGGPLPPEQAAALVATLARAVAHAHGQHVLHRDLKPANVILRDDGAPCVTDFGLARDLDLRSSLTQTSDVVGTPYYMAPERFRGDGRDDPRIDVYALGVILYECLTGRRPFEAVTPTDLLRRLETTPPLPPHVANPDVPSALGAVCLRAMAPAAADRHVSADALASDLDPFARPALARASVEPEALPDAPARTSRLEALAAALLVGGLIACAAVAWWAFGADEPPPSRVSAPPPRAAAPRPVAVDAPPPTETPPPEVVDATTFEPPAPPAPSAVEAPSEPPRRYDRPSPPAAAERQDDRRAMVDRIRALYRGLPSAVLEVMARVPRHAFVHPGAAPRAYEETPLPHFEGQTVSAPGVVAIMTAALNLAPGEKVLEIGTCSGYQAAVLAHLTPRVYSIELLEPLVVRAREALAAQGYDEVTVRQGDGFHGWPEEAPFDAVLLTCAAPRVPEPLWEQLAPGGRIVMPEGEPGRDHALVVIVKEPDGRARRHVIMGVRFSPMTGEIQRPR